MVEPALLPALYRDCVPSLSPVVFDPSLLLRLLWTSSPCLRCHVPLRNPLYSSWALETENLHNARHRMPLASLRRTPCSPLSFISPSLRHSIPSDLVIGIRVMLPRVPFPISSSSLWQGRTPSSVNKSLLTAHPRESQMRCAPRHVLMGDQENIATPTCFLVRHVVLDSLRPTWHGDRT